MPTTLNIRLNKRDYIVKHPGLFAWLKIKQKMMVGIALQGDTDKEDEQSFEMRIKHDKLLAFAFGRNGPNYVCGNEGDPIKVWNMGLGGADDKSELMPTYPEISKFWIPFLQDFLETAKLGDVKDYKDVEGLEELSIDDEVINELEDPEDESEDTEESDPGD